MFMTDYKDKSEKSTVAYHYNFYVLRFFGIGFGNKSEEYCKNDKIPVSLFKPHTLPYSLQQNRAGIRGQKSHH